MTTIYLLYTGWLKDRREVTQLYFAYFTSLDVLFINPQICEHS